MEIGTFTIVKGRGVWKLQGALGVDIAADLLQTAVSITSDPKLRKLRLELPAGPGIALAGFQVLRVLQDHMQAAGKECEVVGNFVPYGGRAW